MNPKDRVISMGYTFSYRHHRKGFAFEGVKSLTDCLHERYREWDFICFTDSENEASMGLLKKFGYQRLGFPESPESKMSGKWTNAVTKEAVDRS